MLAGQALAINSCSGLVSPDTGSALLLAAAPMPQRKKDADPGGTSVRNTPLAQSEPFPRGTGKKVAWNHNNLSSDYFILDIWHIPHSQMPD
jgi:hypothetical protein